MRKFTQTQERYEHLVSGVNAPVKDSINEVQLAPS